MANFRLEQENMVEDLQSVDQDIEVIAEKFITPIDNLRSSAIRPSVIVENGRSSQNVSLSEFIVDKIGSVQVSSSGEKVESRTHAFYRILGLPVMASDGSFFNPGFNPNERENTIDHLNIVNKISTNVQKLQILREQEYKNRSLIFKKQDINSTIYTLALQFIKPFNNIAEGKATFEFDKQSFSVTNRDLAIRLIFSNINQTISNTFTSGTHILKPFLVDPFIEAIVTPCQGGTKPNRICVPFLKSKNDTKLERDIYHYRPAIENILINRLSQPTLTVSQLTNLTSFLQISDEDMQSIVQALQGDPTFSESVLLTGSGSPSVNSLLITNKLIRQLKIIIKLLIQAMHQLNEISIKMNVFPVPNANGPEFGLNLGTIFNSNNKPLDSRILELQVKNFASSSTTDLASQDRGQYAGTFFEVIKRTYTDELNDLLQQRNEYGMIVEKCFRTIELVTGEVSGLGLIDIIAIYTALWSIDIDVLLGLLDSDAFTRMLNNNPELITDDVGARQGGLILTGDTVLQRLENRIVSILKYSDKLFRQYMLSPNVEEPGVP